MNELFKCAPRKCPNGQMTGDCVFYTGPNLSNGIKTNDSLNDVIQKLADGICTQLTITTQPTSKSVVEGNSVAFSISVSGTTPTYQWYLNSVEISGATSQTFTVTETTLTMSGNQYHVVVTNSCSTVSSSIATLTVTAQTQSLTAYYSYQDTDVRSLIEAGEDSTIDYSSVQFVDGATTITIPSVLVDQKFVVFKYPVSQTDFNGAYTNQFNNFDMTEDTDISLRKSITVGEWKYITSRYVDFVTDSTAPTLTFTK